MNPPAIRPSFFAELQRRHVYKVGAMYGVAGWLLVQIATQVFPFFEISNAAVRWVVIAVVAGFPIALILAWLFDITPQGIVRTEELDATGETGAAARERRGTDRKLNYLLGVLVIIGIGYFIAERTLLKSDRERPASTMGGNKSIAVLPFENLSDDKANAYFAEGIQDEILTKLAGIADLRVMSRTSTAKYASHPDNLITVAQQLSVEAVLEGSVQKAGDATHINVQLIDVRSQAQLWAESYDGNLKDVFGVERDVAEKVASALKARWLPAETARAARIPTQDPGAYDLYLRGGYHANRGYDQDALVLVEMPQAIVFYQQALERDPNFALAASALALAHLYMYWHASDHPAAHLAAAKAAAERALALQPDLGEGRLSLALYYYWGHRDYAQALQQLELARRALPNSADVALVFATIARRQGRWDDAIDDFQRAIVLDPRSSQYPGQLGQTYQVLRRYAEADQAFSKAVLLTQSPADEQVRHALNDVIWKGDLASLRAVLSKLRPGDEGYSGNAINFYHLSWWSRDYLAAANTAASITTADWIDRSNVSLPARLYLAWAYEALGERGKAIALHADLKDRLQNALLEQPEDANLHLALAFADAGLGLKQEAIREGQKVAVLIPVSKDALSGPDYLVFLAQLYMRVGDVGAAFDRLDSLFAIPAGHIVSPALLTLDPIWEPLRKYPRFQKLIAIHDSAIQPTTRPEATP